MATEAREPGSRKQQNEVVRMEEVAGGEGVVERPAVPQCRDCRAWRPLTNTAGLCLRRSPQLVHQPDKPELAEFGIWPETHADDGCWDHLPIEAAR